MVAGNAPPARLGAITDGIDRELEHALEVMREFGLTHAELQYVWDKEVGDHTDAETGRIADLLAGCAMRVSCISRHIFGGLDVFQTEVGGAAYAAQTAKLERCIDLAQAVGAPLVRVMSFRKETILFGGGGAEQWNVSRGAWDKLKTLFEPAVRLAADRGAALAVETGNNAMVKSVWLGRKLIDELGAKNLKILWDPANSLYCAERPFPDACGLLRGGYLGHLHIKDARVDMPKARVDQVALGEGQMAPYLADIAAALDREGYDGAISLESVYRPPGGGFEDGFRASIARFKQLFGGGPR